ncbi:hypothetical protein KM155_19955 [Burkholderia pseudomallei]|uniref:hypothetical protein n=1 Tax=Burkholderia pseudomallei TaxID=28450 RepID=UPI001A9CF7D4|nr:hypothetical protein [Burkholderia pseudomallei]MBO7790803.1 hypothetical protein [Burkholderia pseudomallei]QTB41140.1 hypothetical protein J3B45_24795 [Burkholderia pseudomallei]QWJ98831.1 hypothetical protein KM155_19955 [Burkholderia pseudomallei]
MTIRRISTKLAGVAAMALTAACSQNGQYGGSPRAGSTGGTITDGVNQPPAAVTPSDGARYGSPGYHGAQPMAPGGDVGDGNGTGSMPAPGSSD